MNNIWKSEDNFLEMAFLCLRQGLFCCFCHTVYARLAGPWASGQFSCPPPPRRCPATHTHTPWHLSFGITDAWYFMGLGAQTRAERLSQQMLLPAELAYWSLLLPLKFTCLLPLFLVYYADRIFKDYNKQLWEWISLLYPCWIFRTKHWFFVCFCIYHMPTVGFLKFFIRLKSSLLRLLNSHFAFVFV